jgi:hypothetical protein
VAKPVYSKGENKKKRERNLNLKTKNHNFFFIAYTPLSLPPLSTITTPSLSTANPEVSSIPFLYFLIFVVGHRDLLFQMQNDE